MSDFTENRPRLSIHPSTIPSVLMLQIKHNKTIVQQ